MNTNRLNVKSISIVSRSTAKRETNRLEIQKSRLQARRENRASQFYSTRGLDIEKENAVQTRAQRMEEYKQKKLKQKLEEQKKKLPPFRAGIVRHTMDSPYKYFDRKEETVSTASKPFKFTLKPRLPPAKFTIPYSPKFSKIGGHRVCLENPSTATRPTTVHNRAIDTLRNRATLSARANPISHCGQTTVPQSARQQRPRSSNNMEVDVPDTSSNRKQAKELTVNKNSRATAPNKKPNGKTKLSLEKDSETPGTRTIGSLDKSVENRKVSNPKKVATSQTMSVGSRESPRFTRNSDKSPFNTPAELKEIEVFQFTSRVDRALTKESNDKKAEEEDGKMETFIEKDLNQSIDIPEFFVKRRSTKDSLRKRCLITPTKEPELTTVSGPEYQRRRLNEERNILHRLCYLWYDTLQADSEIPVDIRDEIDCVAGQTKLLTSDKFEQMSTLIDQFEAQESGDGQTQSGPRILENDLDSFWDMIYIQVELMYKKFDRLKRLKEDGWLDKEEEERREKENEKRKQRTKMGSKATSARVGAKSRIADFIRSKRIEAKSVASPAEDVARQTKVFTGGFFKIESPISEKTRSKVSESHLSKSGTPHVKSILKNKMSSLNIVSMSPLAKTLAATSLLDFISTPSDETRSILKSSNKSDSKPKSTRGGKKICFTLFDPQEEEIFSTPRESPRKQICKTPHKSSSPLESNDTLVGDPETPRPPLEESTVTFLPRKSPRLSKAPLRFSFGQFENTPPKLGEKELVMSSKKTPRGSAKTSTSSSSSRSGRFLLRPSRLKV